MFALRLLNGTDSCCPTHRSLPNEKNTKVRTCSHRVFGNAEQQQISSNQRCMNKKVSATGIGAIINKVSNFIYSLFFESHAEKVQKATHNFKADLERFIHEHATLSKKDTVLRFPKIPSVLKGTPLAEGYADARRNYELAVHGAHTDDDKFMYAIENDSFDEGPVTLRNNEKPPADTLLESLAAILNPTRPS